MRWTADLCARMAWILSAVLILSAIVDDRIDWPGSWFDSWIVMIMFLGAALSTAGAIGTGLLAPGGKRWRRLGAVLVGFVVCTVVGHVFLDEYGPEEHQEPAGELEQMEALLKSKLESVLPYLPADYSEDMQLVDVSASIVLPKYSMVYEYSVPEDFDPEELEKKWIENTQFRNCQSRENPDLWRCGYRSRSLFRAADGSTRLSIDVVPANCDVPGAPREETGAPHLVMEVRPEDCKSGAGGR